MITACCVSGTTITLVDSSPRKTAIAMIGSL
jgi:hypothetical protein